MNHVKIPQQVFPLLRSIYRAHAATPLRGGTFHPGKTEISGILHIIESQFTKTGASGGPSNPRTTTSMVPRCGSHELNSAAGIVMGICMGCSRTDRHDKYASNCSLLNTIQVRQLTGPLHRPPRDQGEADERHGW